MPDTQSPLLCLSQTPRLYIADNFVSEDEANHIVAIAADPLTHFGPEITVHNGQAGRSFEMPVAADPVLTSVTDRMHKALRMVNDVGGMLRFRHYQVGESHPLHSDTFEIGPFTLIVTALLYLNDTELGGGTYFPRAQPQPLLIQPKRRQLVVWFNHTPDGKVDGTAIHEALPVERGEKLTVANFVYKPLSFCSTQL